MVGLSKDIEGKLDNERNSKVKVKKEQSLLSNIGIISGELELDGRRLVIMEALSKDQAVHKKEDEAGKEHKLDKRNVALKEFGLIDEENWIHRLPAMTQLVFDQRKHLLSEKEQALKKSSNLFVSNTRMTIRHLPKRDFFEKELKELILMVIDEWSKTLNEEQRKGLNTKKLLK